MSSRLTLQCLVLSSSDSSQCPCNYPTLATAVPPPFPPLLLPFPSHVPFLSPLNNKKQVFTCLRFDVSTQHTSALRNSDTLLSCNFPLYQSSSDLPAIHFFHAVRLRHRRSCSHPLCAASARMSSGTEPQKSAFNGAYLTIVPVVSS